MLKFLPVLAGLLPAVAFAEVAHRTGSVHTSEVDLAYETFGVAGADIPIIAVNGGPGLSHAYMMQNDLWQRVAAHRLVILYDQRGTGASKRVESGAPQSMDAQVADLDAVRGALSLDRVAVLGDSYGGMIAMAYAAAHPQHVARLILSDSAAPSWKGLVHLLPQVFPDREQQGAAEAKKLAADPEAAAQAGFVNHMRMCFYSTDLRDAYLAHMGDLGFVPAVGAAVQKATENLDLTSKLADFKFPTLVITGRYDMNVAPLTAWRMAHAIPGAQLVFFEKSGHLPAYEEPDKYLKVLEGFLANSKAEKP
ncbi:MAG TPA: alpha/beta fold hydrolase [Steroidobacteraceae bacterium]